MRSIALSAALIPFLAVSWAWSETNDVYYDLFGMVEGSIDANAGLTTFPSLLIPTGGRFEGMGTAFTAVADDSGYLEANPAASASLQRSELSVLHNNWIADTRIEGVVYTRRFADLGIGVGAKVLYLPFTHYDVWGDRAGSAHISETIASLNTSYNFLSSYEFFGLSVGANIKAAYRHVPEVLASGQSAAGIMADVGLLTRFNLLKFYNSRERNFSIGTVVKNVGPLVDGEPLPMYWTSGIAYAPLRPILVSFDFTYPFTFDPVNFPAEQWFMAAGVDVAITNFLSVHTGFRYKAANPRITLGSAVDLERISFVANYVLDFAGGTKFSVEAKLDLGDDGRAERRSVVDHLYVSGLNAYAKGKYEEAIALWQQALTVDPKFTPARTNLELVRELVDLQEAMGDIEIKD